MEAKILKCECDISNSEIDTTEIKKFTPKTIYESFYDVLKFTNYKVLLCYKLAFSVNSLTSNKGSIIAIISFCIYLLFLIVYTIKGINQFQIEIAKRIFKSPSIIKNDDIKNRNSTKNLETIVTDTKEPNTIRIKNSKKIKHFPPKKQERTKKHYSTRKRTIKPIINNFEISNTKLSDKDILVRKKFKAKTKNYIMKTDNGALNEEKGDEKQKEEGLDNFELNDLEYEEAIKLDKRSFIQIYWNLLKREHLILFTFFVRNDYNITWIKFCRFIFLLCTDMALNVFFFSDETMHKMYLSYGKYDFIQQIPQIIYSTVVSQVIEVFLCFLSLTDKHYYEIKNMEIKDKYKIFSILKCIKRKLTTFLIFTFIMFAFYWYTIACFCAVYKNTQIAFIKDSLSSFGLGLLYPFILYLFPALLRLIALRTCKKKISFIYWLSDAIPFF